MLCPNCGMEVGDMLQLCEGCELKRKEQVAAQETQAMAEAAQCRRLTQKISRPKGNSSSQEANSAPGIVLPEEDPLVQIFNFMSSPMGIVLSCTIIYLVLFLGIVLFIPGKGLIGSALLSLVVSGFCCGIAAPYAFAFDQSQTRKRMGVAIGWTISGIGLGLYSLYSGKHVVEVYSEMKKATFGSQHATEHYDGNYDYNDYQ